MANEMTEEDELTYRLHDTDSGEIELTQVAFGFMPVLLIRISEGDGDFAIEVDHSAPAEGEIELLEMYQDILEGIIEARKAGEGDD